MFCAFAQDFGTPAQHHPTKPGPVLVIVVHDYRDRRIFCNVSQSLERSPGNSFRLVVDGDVERAFEDREAYGHHMRDRAPIGSGKMSDALVRQEPALDLCQHQTPPRILSSNGSQTSSAISGL